MSLRDEIIEQPEAARRQLASSPDALEAVAARLRSEPVESVVVAARGTSDHAAIYAQYLLGVRNRLVVGLATPSVVSLYGAEPRVGRALVIGISQSGASPDIVGVVEAAARQGAPTLAITNDPDSPLAHASDHVLELAAGPERAVAATKTYTTSLLADRAAVTGARSGSGGICRADGRARRDARRARRGSGRRSAGCRARGGIGVLRPVRRRRTRLRVRHGARVGAEAQGARPGLRRPVLRGGLPARPDRARPAGDPGARARAGGRARPKVRRSCCATCATVASTRSSSRTSPRRAPSAAGTSRFPPACRNGFARSSRSFRHSSSRTT